MDAGLHLNACRNSDPTVIEASDWAVRQTQCICLLDCFSLPHVSVTAHCSYPVQSS